MKKITILSIDGGGIRGIIPCIILRYIEEQIQLLDYHEAKIGDYFDLISGSSTGGLLAAILLYPNDQQTAKYSIKTAFDLYTEKGSDIFNVSFWQKIINPFGLFSEKISEEQLEKHLADFFGNLELKNLIKPSLITAYDLENRRAKLFNSMTAHLDSNNFKVKDICRATSAAPTYFSPAQIKSKYGQLFTLIDGGVFANNPALCAYAEARKIPFGNFFQDIEKPNYPSIKNMMIVSIGTGTVLKKYSYNKFESAGKLKWIEPIIDILLAANAETVDYQLSQMVSTLGKRSRQNYFRINPSIKNASSEMDDVRRENIEALIQAGLSYVDEHKELLHLLAKKLIKNKIASKSLVTTTFGTTSI